ncbi:MAG: hypothetical protein SWX82_21405, partial [Cyanobacteriota bacterium]|nr:hypothetical protein [Cyanobacteriota bacterium]
HFPKNNNYHSYLKNLNFRNTLIYSHPLTIRLLECLSPREICKSDFSAIPPAFSTKFLRVLGVISGTFFNPKKTLANISQCFEI